MPTTLESLNVEVQEVKLLLKDYAARTVHMENLLIRGDGDRLPLAEVVRTLATTLEKYIKQKEKEEAEAELRRTEEEKERKEFWTRILWIVAGVVIPAVIAVVTQAIVFYIRLFPLLEKLAT